MKKLAILALSILLAVVFIAASTNQDTQNEYTLEGVWEMKHQYIYENNEILDTLFNLNGARQVKVYSKGKVMWSRFDPTDTNEWFGYGTYEVKDGILEERLEYASQAMMKIVDTVQVFRFQLKLGENTYSQISFDNDGNKYNSENYTRIE